MNTGLIFILKVNIFLELFDINTYFVELSPSFAMAYSLITGVSTLFQVQASRGSISFYKCCKYVFIY